MSNVKILEAINTNAPLLSIKSAFDVYDRVYQSIDPSTVLIFPKTQDDFQPTETLLALHKNEIVGVAILKPAVEFKDNSALFGNNAIDILDKQFKTSKIEINRVANMAVLPNVQGQGIAQKLFEYAALKSNGHCIAAITQDNVPSAKAASKAGYQLVPECQYSNRFRFQDNKPVLDPKGDQVLNWFIVSHTTSENDLII